MTIDRARQILGTKYNNLTDEEIQEVLESLQYLARKLLDNK